MTDGFWNGPSALFPRDENSDGESGKIMYGSAGEKYQYLPISPFSDGFSDTLADVAMYYWKTDLRADWSSPLQKNVPVANSAINPAFWQHLTQFTVGLGVQGSLNPKTDLPDLNSGLRTWPKPENDSIFNIDDLWHAAINGHGKFFSANNSMQFSDGLSSALNDIANQSSSTSGVGYSNFQIQQNGKILIASYNTENWSGTLEQKSLDLLTNTISSDWIVNQSTKWPISRNVFTYKSQTRKGIEFKFSNLDMLDQKYFSEAAITIFNAEVTGQEIIDYLKGVQSQEIKNGGVFRNRENLLGDIVGSLPEYSKRSVDEGYSFYR